jgi:hypothetical protein
MPYSILHVIPYMHPSAGGPPFVVENFIRESNRLGHRYQIISTPSCCKGDQSNLLKRLEQLAPTTFLNVLETLPVLSRTGAAKISAHVQQADIVHVHTLWSPYQHDTRVSGRIARTLMPHGMLDPYSLSVKALKKSTYLQLFEKYNITCAQRIIYTTLEEERLAALAGLRLPPGQLVPLGARASSAFAAGKFRNHNRGGEQMGVPVIITDKVNTWPYVKEARAGLVLDERDIDALLPHAIEALLKDDARRSEMGVQGRRYAHERLTWQASARELLNCYEQVLSGSSALANWYGS